MKLKLQLLTIVQGNSTILFQLATCINFISFNNIISDSIIVSHSMNDICKLKRCNENVNKELRTGKSIETKLLIVVNLCIQLFTLATYIQLRM